MVQEGRLKTLRTGGYEIDLVDDGLFGLDGGSMFGIVPRHAWARLMPPDEANRVDMALRAVLVRGGGRVILIDAGIGNKIPKKLAARMNIRRDEGTPGKLRALGIGPGDITDVIATHLHFDHAGGLTTQVGCEIILTYPNARIHVQRACLEWARRPSEKDAASFMAHDVEPLVGSPNLHLLDGDCEVLPGIRVISTNGHSPGTQVVVVSHQPSPSFAFLSDLVSTVHHLRLPYIAAFDVAPLDTLNEKKRVLSQAVDEGWIVCFPHDTNTPACTLAKNEKGEVVARNKVAL
ncbi:MAG: MBL fold metallo-hydrolase [Deltaproteobacteria bacterium]|nr:MBL fold metallo-hydrolase [Deltaproteobacteria bacterium]